MSVLVEIKGGDLWTTSHSVATEFDRRHNNVMRELERLIKRGTIDVRDFAHISYIDSMGRKQRAYELNERAFLTAMPFIGGEKSEAGQKRLVDEFLVMRKQLARQALQSQDAYWQQKRLEGKSVRLALTDTVQNFVSYAKKQGSQNAEKYYLSITKMEYAALELVKQAGDKHFRDTLDAVQHSELTVVELAAQEALRQGMTEGLHYKEVFKLAKDACVQLAQQLRKFLPRSAVEPLQTLALVKG